MSHGARNVLHGTGKVLHGAGKVFHSAGKVPPGLQKDGNGGNVFPANLRFWQPLLAS